jgi:hypothetical protein
MTIDWASVKKETLWSYEDLIGKLLSVLAYGFVQEHYNHTVEQAQAYAQSIRHGYLQGQGGMTAHVDSIAAHLQDLAPRWSGTYSELVHSAATRPACLALLEETGFGFDQLIQVLNYLLRWVLPFQAPLREYIDADGSIEAGHLNSLRREGIRSNLDLLEAGRTAAGRARLAGATHIPAAALLALVHRVDISRLAYVRGKTVKHLCGGGYDTLEKLANADLAEMEEAMAAYYRTLGKTFADFEAVIPLSWMIGGAKILPRVISEQ